MSSSNILYPLELQHLLTLVVIVNKAVCVHIFLFRVEMLIFFASNCF